MKEKLIKQFQKGIITPEEFVDKILIIRSAEIQKEDIISKEENDLIHGYLQSCIEVKNALHKLVCAYSYRTELALALAKLLS